MIVYTTGAWDLLHIGHVNMLKRSKLHGTILVVGVMTDEFIKWSKGKYPIFNYGQRAAMVKSLECVDFVEPIMHYNDYRVLNKYDVKIRTVGSDYGGKSGHGKAMLEMARRGIEIVTIQRYPGISTTEIIERIKGCEYHKKSSDCSVRGLEGCGLPGWTSSCTRRVSTS